jgi:hypothetical protein
MRELDAKGRFSTVVLTVAILVDIVVIVVFSVATEFGSSVHEGQQFNPWMSALVRFPSFSRHFPSSSSAGCEAVVLCRMWGAQIPIGHLFLALGLGAVLGHALVEMLRALRPQRKEVKAAAVLVVATAAYYSVQELLHSEPLLVCVYPPRESRLFRRPPTPRTH